MTLRHLPDIAEVSAISGYTSNAVDRWIVKGSLRSVIVQTGIITCREWLIDFYCDDGYNIVKKGGKHQELLRQLNAITPESMISERGIMLFSHIPF